MAERKRASAPVAVGVAPNPVIAAMWQEALRRAGIVAYIRNRDVAGGLYGAPPVPFSCELLVSPGDALAARAILDDLETTATP